MNIFFDNYSKTKKYSGVQYYAESLFSWIEGAEIGIQRFGFGGNYSENSQFNNSAKLIPQKAANRMQRYGVLPKLGKFIAEPVELAIFPDFVIWPVKARRKVVVIHDFTFLDRPDELSQANASYLQKQVPKSLEVADTILTTSQIHKDRMISDFLVDKSKILILPSIPNKSLAKKQSKPKEKNYLFCINSIEPRKNIELLLDAYVKLPKEIKDSHPLILTGVTRNTGKHIAEKMTRLKDSGENIIYKGRLSDKELGQYLQHASALVNASHYEGFGMQLLEASLVKTPVVCSDIPIFKDVMGDSAEYFNQDDVNQITESIKKVLNSTNIQKKLIDKSQNNLKRYSEKDNIKKLKALL